MNLIQIAHINISLNIFHPILNGSYHYLHNFHYKIRNNYIYYIYIYHLMILCSFYIKNNYINYLLDKYYLLIDLNFFCEVLLLIYFYLYYI